jgi:uncharacterized membrane protein YkgB
MDYNKIDSDAISLMQRFALPFARFAIFLIFFWFGLLKILDASPASPLVISLLTNTLPFIQAETFLIWFGVFEMIVGIAFIIPRLERVAIALLIIHFLTTILPLFMLKSLTWQSTFIPTLEGQYIIKNILIITVAVSIAAHIHPRQTRF